MHIWCFPRFGLEAAGPQKLIITAVGSEEIGTDVLSKCLAEHKKYRSKILVNIAEFTLNVIGNTPVNKEKVNILHREEGIFEIKPVPLRLVFFYDQNMKYPVTNTACLTAEKAAVLVLYFEKRQDKTKPQYIDRALGLKKEYLEAKSHGALILHVAEAGYNEECI